MQPLWLDLSFVFLAERVKFTGFFGFTYSERPNTPALNLVDDVPEAEKSARLEEICRRYPPEGRRSAILPDCRCRINICLDGPTGRDLTFLLTPDRIKVVRNDLSDVDLEIVSASDKATPATEPSALRGIQNEQTWTPMTSGLLGAGKT